ncbi:MAG: hypothetical protein GKR86_11000 [Ilumatobacter sp.]|nr:hypothetical protein [Ilumatobacter sp.]
MVVRVASFVVQGVAGSGRSTALIQWIDDVELARRCRPREINAAIAAVNAADIDHWHAEADGDVGLAVDDAELLPDDAIAALVAVAEHRPVGLAVASWPRSQLLGRLVDRLLQGTQGADAAEHKILTPLDADSVGALLDDTLIAAPAEVLLRQTGGNAGLVAASIRSGWVGDLNELEPTLADAVLRRVERHSGRALDALRLAAAGIAVSSAISVVESQSSETGSLAHELKAGGLVADGLLVPLAASVINSDTPAADRRRLADLVLANGPDAVNLGLDDLALLHWSATSSSQTERAAAALRLGLSSASSAIAELPDLSAPAAAAVAFADDLRHLRLDRAAQRRLDGELGAALTGLVLTVAGQPAVADDSPVADPAAARWRELERSLVAFLEGDRDRAVRDALRAHDDALRAGDGTLAGITVSSVVGLLLLQTGEPSLAADVMTAAIAADLGGPGERRTHRLVAAHAAVRLGDFSGALDLTRRSEHLTPAETGRDALLVASLNATVAQRSGDTARLRDAWTTARPLVERGLETWLLADQIVDLAVTGTRIGEQDPASRLFSRLVKGFDGLPSAGPASMIAEWGRLQLDIAAERWDLVASLDATAGNATVPDKRSAARRIAGSAWAEVAAARSGSQSASFELVSEAADALAAVGDDWDASRLLGQAALDDDDPQRARELLELARGLVSEPVESSDRLVAAGLSEREAEVSRLVVEGHTYKEIGAVLYISPKTVEHHVARIRQRLGVTSRAELLATVRELLSS